MREAEVHIQFENLNEEQTEKLFKIEMLLHEIGIHFDTGGGAGFRDWELDWSLEGPVKVFHGKFKDEQDGD